MPDRPTVRAWAGRNVKNPAIPHIPSKAMKPGNKPAGWISGERGRLAALPTTAGAVSGVRTERTTASAAISAVTTQTAS